MGYRYTVAITMLQKDWDELREFIKTIKDEYTQGEFNFDSESPFEVRGLRLLLCFATNVIGVLNPKMRGLAF